MEDCTDQNKNSNRLGMNIYLNLIIEGNTYISSNLLYLINKFLFK